MSYLHVLEQGAHVRKKGGHIEVARDGELLDDRVIAEIKCLVAFGGVQVTSDAMLALLDGGCDIAFMTLNGHFKGRVVSATGKNSLLRLAQYDTLRDPAKRHAITRRYVAAKIRNGMDVLDDYHRSGHSGFVFDERERLEVILHSVKNESDGKVGEHGRTTQSLLGFEGAAARLYFSGSPTTASATGR
jgi:CRISPR-associated protein Cas1